MQTPACTSKSGGFHCRGFRLGRMQDELTPADVRATTRRFNPVKGRKRRVIFNSDGDELIQAAYGGYSDPLRRGRPDLPAARARHSGADGRRTR